MTMGSDQRDAQEGLTAVYGLPPREVVEVPHGAVQTSPLVPGARPLEDIPDGSLAAAIVLAPPGTIERRYVLAQILRALAPGALLVALAPKDKGGQRLAAELRSFGAAGDQEPRRHHRAAAS